MISAFTPKRLSVLARYIIARGHRVPSVRGETIEIEDAMFSLGNPRDRISTEKWRRMNMGFAITDALSHIIGDNALAPLLQFAPSFAQFSTNGRTIDGSYGNRIHTAEQLNATIEMLKRDPQTRRAVISIYMGPVDLLGGGGKNTPCTLNFHFLVRSGRLNMKVMMRSNDVFLGLTNDVFTFTMLHEWVSIKTGIPLGKYSHFASSLHIYDKDVKKIPLKTEPRYPYIMEPMPDDFHPNTVYNLIAQIPKWDIPQCIEAAKTFSSSYARDLFLTCVFMSKRNDVRATNLILPMVEMPILSDMCSLFVEDGD